MGAALAAKLFGLWSMWPYLLAGLDEALVSPCWASHFFLSGQEKVTKKKHPGFAAQNSPRYGVAPGVVAKGHPWPIAPRSASMPRDPLRNAYARPPEGGSGPSRLDVFEQQQSAFLI